MNWRNNAACLGMDTNVFFPERGDVVAVRLAQATCAACPVRDECLADAVATDDHGGFGIRGGVGPKQRRKLRAASRPGPKPGTLLKPIEHGTDAAYHRHWRLGITPCQSCREAHNACEAERKAARRGRATDDHGGFGIRGGVGPKQRRKLRAASRPGPKPGTLLKPIEHGTDAAYYRHRRLGTTPCQSCREAHNAREAERRAARRGRATDAA